MNESNLQGPPQTPYRPPGTETTIEGKTEATEEETTPTPDDRPDVREFEIGQLRAEIRGPAWLLEEVAVDIDFFPTSKDVALLDRITDALDRDRLMARHGTITLKESGGPGAPWDVTIYAGDGYVTRWRDRGHPGFKEAREQFISAMHKVFGKGRGAACFRVTGERDEPGDGEPMGEQRQMGVFQGLDSEGGWAVDPEEGERKTYDSLDSLVKEGWRID